MSKELAPNPSEAVESQAFLALHGLEDIAGLQIEAHGGTFTVSQALVECPPFAKMVTGLAASLEHVPNKGDILKGTIVSMGASATPNVETTKKK